MSIADQTYILNTLVEVAKETTSGGDNQRPWEALYYLRQAEHARFYGVMVTSNADRTNFTDNFSNASAFTEIGEIQTKPADGSDYATKTGQICKTIVDGNDVDSAFTNENRFNENNLTGAGFSDFQSRRGEQSPFIIAEKFFGNNLITSPDFPLSLPDNILTVFPFLIFIFIIKPRVPMK